MSELNSSQIEFKNGDRFWLLVGSDGLPDFDSTLFLASKYQEGNAANTLKNVANAVRVVKRFESKRSIDIKQRLGEGRILSRSEITKLVADCGRPLGEIKKAKSSGNVLPFRKKKVNSEDPSLAPNTQRRRAFYAAQYISFLVDEVTDKLRFDDLRKLSLEAALKKFNDMVEKLAPEQEGPNFDPERPLTQDATKKIKALTSGNQAEIAAQLFKQPKTRKRNLLIIELFLASGVRTSELARLRTDDIDQDSLTINFRRHKSESRTDIRKNRPGFKTRERPIRIDVDLMRRLVDYISAREGGRPRKAKHKYVFCANGISAKAISLSSIYRIIRSLENAFGDGWRKRITPHVLRHTFFDIWFREANARYDFRNNPNLFDQVIAAAELTGGWRPDSKMINHYKQRYVFEQASEITLRTQKRMSKSIKGDDEDVPY